MWIYTSAVFFLSFYGSAVNGLISSITQFLGFISLAECGVGAVVQSALYKPLANNDMQEVSKIMKSADRFFKRIAYILLAYIAILMVFYPLITLKSFDYFFYTGSYICHIYQQFCSVLSGHDLSAASECGSAGFYSV